MNKPRDKLTLEGIDHVALAVRDVRQTKHGMRTIALSVLALLAGGPAVSEPKEEPSGRICLAPLSDPAKGQAARWRAVGDDGLTNYSVKVNDKAAVPMSLVKAQWIPGLDITMEHSVIILAEGAPVDCLDIDSLYFTWQLWPVERTGNWCPNWSSEKAK